MLPFIYWLVIFYIAIHKLLWCHCLPLKHGHWGSRHQLYDFSKHIFRHLKSQSRRSITHNRHGSSTATSTTCKRRTFEQHADTCRRPTTRSAWTGRQTIRFCKTRQDGWVGTIRQRVSQWEFASLKSSLWIVNCDTASLFAIHIDWTIFLMLYLNIVSKNKTNNGQSVVAFHQTSQITKATHCSC